MELIQKPSRIPLQQDPTKTSSLSRSFSIINDSGGSDGSGKNSTEVECLVPLDPLRLAPWIVMVSFLPTPDSIHTSGVRPKFLDFLMT